MRQDLLSDRDVIGISLDACDVEVGVLVEGMMPANGIRKGSDAGAEVHDLATGNFDRKGAGIAERRKERPGPTSAS